nr:AMP-binding protein [Schlegelella koreensis]
MSRLSALVAVAQAQAPAYAELLRGVDAASVASRAALAMLPLTRKRALAERQRAERARDVFGGFATLGIGAAHAPARRAGRVFASPGPIYEPEGAASDYWRMGRAMRASGIQAGDLVHNAFSYHFTPAAAMIESGARALGCTVFPAGIGQTELQVQTIADLRPDAYAGTPSFLKLIVDKAAESGTDIGSITKASVGAEAFPAALRDWLSARGIDAYQSYGTADLGLVAYETSAREGLVLDEDVIVEIVEPGGSTPVVDGEIGEVVVTVLNPDYPLIRFATGDLSAVLPGACPSGRTNTRIRGWLGRADQSAKVRGMFVHPSQVAEVLRRHSAVRKGRLVVAGTLADDRMRLDIELDPGAGDAADLAERVAETIRDVTRLRGEVAIVAPGSLPDDGRLIEDTRAVG